MLFIHIYLQIISNDIIKYIYSMKYSKRLIIILIWIWINVSYDVTNFTQFAVFFNKSNTYFLFFLGDWLCQIKLAASQKWEKRIHIMTKNCYFVSLFLSCLFLFIKNILKNKFKKNKFKYGLICATTKLWRHSEADWEA